MTLSIPFSLRLGISCEKGKIYLSCPRYHVSPQRLPREMSFLVRFLFELILFSVFPRRVPCSRVEEAKELTPWSKDHSCLPAQPAGDFRAFFLSYFFGFMQSWLASDLGRPGSKEMDLASFLHYRDVFPMDQGSRIQWRMATLLFLLLLSTIETLC